MQEDPKQTQFQQLCRHAGKHLKNKIGAGLLVVIPVGITIFILRFLFNLADGILGSYLRRIADVIFGEGHYIPGLGMITGIFVIYLAGLLASNVFGKRMVVYGDNLFSRIPFVKTIYLASKQLMEVFSRKGRGTFQRAVYVDFPKEGSYSIAFITNEVMSVSGKKYYTAFIPTSPNPTSGYVLILEESQVYPTFFSVEEAMKIIMSGGMVAPEIIRAQRLQ
jgi:uncharacterized membrane protein